MCLLERLAILQWKEPPTAGLRKALQLPTRGAPAGHQFVPPGGMQAHARRPSTHFNRPTPGLQAFPRQFRRHVARNMPCATLASPSGPPSQPPAYFRACLPPPTHPPQCRGTAPPAARTCWHAAHACHAVCACRAPRACHAAPKLTAFFSHSQPSFRKKRTSRLLMSHSVPPAACKAPSTCGVPAVELSLSFSMHHLGSGLGFERMAGSAALPAQQTGRPWHCCPADPVKCLHRASGLNMCAPTFWLEYVCTHLLA